MHTVYMTEKKKPAPKSDSKNTKDDIVQTGATILRETATEIDTADIHSPHITHLITKMKEMLATEKHGVALAAPQAGEALRLFIVAGRIFQPEKETGTKEIVEGGKEETSQYIIDVAEKSDSKIKKEVAKIIKAPDRVFINPVIARHSRTQSIMEEGCLSVHGLYGSVKRYDKATIHALDENGKKITYHATGLLAQIFQHETDHLNGILYTDKAVALEKVDENKKKTSKK